MLGYDGFMLDVYVSIHPSVLGMSVHLFFISGWYQWVFSKLGMCINIMEIWFGIANGQISSSFDSYLPSRCLYFRFWTMITWVKINKSSPNLASGERMCTILVNHLEDWACPVKVWLGKLFDLDMTPLGWLGHKTSTGANHQTWYVHWHSYLPTAGYRRGIIVSHFYLLLFSISV